LGTRQCFTKEALEKTKGTVKHEQSRDTDNIKQKTMFYKRSYREDHVHS
jgi:NAD(P)H-dependent flavin oxidoreductase YrpB (nitropropane dioxygenase family)